MVSIRACLWAHSAQEVRQRGVNSQGAIEVVDRACCVDLVHALVCMVGLDAWAHRAQVEEVAHLR